MFKYLIFTLIACEWHGVTSNTVSPRDVIILFKGSPNHTVDINAIKSLPRTNQLFRVKETPMPGVSPKGWEFCVIAKGFPVEEDINTYISSLKKFPFIGMVEPLIVTDGGAAKTFLTNLLIKSSRIVGRIMGTLPSRPLKPQTPPLVKCDTVDLEPGVPLYSMSFMRSGDQKVLKDFGWKVVTKVFAALDVRFEYFASSQSKRWPEYNMAKYADKATFCEYMLSELVIKWGQEFMKAFAEIQAFTAVLL